MRERLRKHYRLDCSVHYSYIFFPPYLKLFEQDLDNFIFLGLCL